MLGESEGVARGILTLLKKRGLINVRRQVGVMVSRRGLRELSTLMKRRHLRVVGRVDYPVLGLGPNGVVFQVAKCSGRLNQGIEQRDAAIKTGATSAVTFLFDGKTLKFPGVSEPVSTRSPAIFQQLKKELKMKKGDVVIIALGDSWWEAARGGFAAVKTLA